MIIWSRKTGRLFYDNLTRRRRKSAQIFVKASKIIFFTCILGEKGVWYVT